MEGVSSQTNTNTGRNKQLSILCYNMQEV